MANKLMLTFLGFEVLFLLSGGLLIGFALFSESSMRSKPTPDTVAPHILLKRTPLTAIIVNAIFIFATFLMALPAIFLPTNRGWLRLHGYMVTFCATFTLVVGLILWIETLQTRSMLGIIWASEAPEAQSLMQQKVCSAFPGFALDNAISRVSPRLDGLGNEDRPGFGEIKERSLANSISHTQWLFGQMTRYLMPHDGNGLHNLTARLPYLRFSMRLTHFFFRCYTTAPPSFAFP